MSITHVLFIHRFARRLVGENPLRNTVGLSFLIRFLVPIRRKDTQWADTPARPVGRVIEILETAERGLAGDLVTRILDHLSCALIGEAAYTARSSNIHRNGRKGFLVRPT